mmetsp:Transcript_29233/g.57383  ORF Transcript_29233/g.57383 Transcript_29233/m.57383 type:complete len:287 (-) Transcript_29233:961-1821(-)
MLLVGGVHRECISHLVVLQARARHVDLHVEDVSVIVGRSKPLVDRDGADLHLRSVGLDHRLGIELIAESDELPDVRPRLEVVEKGGREAQSRERLGAKKTLSEEVVAQFLDTLLVGSHETNHWVHLSEVYPLLSRCGVHLLDPPDLPLQKSGHGTRASALTLQSRPPLSVCVVVRVRVQIEGQGATVSRLHELHCAHCQALLPDEVVERGHEVPPRLLSLLVVRRLNEGGGAHNLELEVESLECVHALCILGVLHRERCRAVTEAGSCSSSRRAGGRGGGQLLGVQ